MAAHLRSIAGFVFACAFGTMAVSFDDGVVRAQHRGGQNPQCVTLPDAVPGSAAARQRNPQRCPPAIEQTYTLRTTDAQSATPEWKSAYSANGTYELYFALDITEDVIGPHLYTLFIFMPGGLPYGYIQSTFTATECTSVFGGTCSVETTSGGIRVWTSMPVAGTMIQQFQLYGTWRADVHIDGSAGPTASTNFEIEP